MNFTNKIWNLLYRGISVRKKILISFFWIFIILTALFVGVVAFQSHRNTDTMSANIAARTRMLVEKVLLNSHISLSDDGITSKKAKEELQKSIDQLGASYEILKNGGNDLTTDNADIYINAEENPKILFLLKEIEPIFLRYKSFVDVLIKEPKFIEQKNRRKLSDTSSSEVYSGFVKIYNPLIEQAVIELNHYSQENELLAANQKLATLYFKSLEDQDRLFLILFIAFFVMGMGVILFNSVLIFIYIVKPVKEIAKAADNIALGDINTKIEYDINDELGRIVGSINTLTENLRKTTEFITRIGKGDFEADYSVKAVEGMDEKDNLGFALVNMRNQLRTISDEDRKRNWVTEGLAKFGELLRKGSDDVETLSYDIIYNLVKYLDANQGSIFIVTETEKNKEVLELKACYAWDRKKFRNMKVNKGEGLVGQAWQENETIYLSDFPADYIEITSGLGKANPNNLMIVPLKLNDITYGIIEVASFKEFQKFQREFIEKIGESIASTISSVKINSQTKKLLEETQQQSEEMRAQEEEMRQNMEEMQATQEEMTRKEVETKKMLENLKHSEEQSKAQEEKLRQTMDEMAAAQEEILQYKEDSEVQRRTIHAMSVISKTDANGNIIYANDEFIKLSKYSREELMGGNHRILKSGHQSEAFYLELWSTISKGKIWRNDIKNKAKDGSYYWVDLVVSPLLDKTGKIKEYIAQGLLITEKKQKEELMAKELEELKKKK